MKLNQVFSLLGWMSRIVIVGVILLTLGGCASRPSENDAGGQTNFSVVLTDAGGQKIQLIKALREVEPAMGLAEAKGMSENTPVTIKEGIPMEEAEAIRKKLEAAGATVEIK